MRLAFFSPLSVNCRVTPSLSLYAPDKKSTVSKHAILRHVRLVRTEYTLRFLARIDANQHGVTRLKRVTKASQERRNFGASKISQARTKPENALGFGTDFGGFQPFQGVIIGTVQSVQLNVLVI